MTYKKDTRTYRSFHAQPPRRKFVYSKRTSRRNEHIKVVGVILFTIGFGWYILHRNPTPTTDVGGQGVLAATSKPQPPAIDEPALAANIQQIIAANPQLDIGVAMTDLSRNESYTYGVDAPFIAASVGKILSATLYLKQVEDGQRTLDDQLGGLPARQQIQKMIAQSDNTAWYAINDLLTRPALEAYARQQGLTSYVAEGNKVKSNDVNTLLGLLYQKKLLNEDHTNFLLSNMRQDQEEIQFIRPNVPAEVTVYHKAGWLADRAHDTAIIENGDRPFTLVIFTKARYGNYDFRSGQKLFAQFTTTALTAMKL